MDEMFNIVNGHHIEVTNKLANKEIREWTDERRSEMQKAEKEEIRRKRILRFFIPEYSRGEERFLVSIITALLAIMGMTIAIIDMIVQPLNITTITPMVIEIGLVSISVLLLAALKNE